MIDAALDAVAGEDDTDDHDDDDIKWSVCIIAAILVWGIIAAVVLLLRAS
jgi:hypothetical protein